MLAVVLGSSAVVAGAAERARGVILFIGDGLGPVQVRCARAYHGGPLEFETLAHQAVVTTRSADHPVTDSAAAATAIATGVKVNNGVLSVALPGDGRPLKTMLETFAEQGRATGLVTTDQMTQATPAAFGAHVPSRKNAAEIAEHYIRRTRPNVLIGGGKEGMDEQATAAAGYALFTQARQMQAAVEKALAMPTPMLAGLIGDGKFPYLHHDAQANPRQYGAVYPKLAEMTTAALTVLDRDPDGFFLMVESALVDKSGHAQLVKDDVDRLKCNVLETLTLADAVGAARRWAAGRKDVLIVVTADHETGGLQLVRERGRGEFPDAKWAHKLHTGVNVMVHAQGPGAERFAGELDNADLHRLILQAAGN
jgi:alkaline phosphatase